MTAELISILLAAFAALLATWSDVILGGIKKEPNKRKKYLNYFFKGIGTLIIIGTLNISNRQRLKALSDGAVQKKFDDSVIYQQKVALDSLAAAGVSLTQLKKSATTIYSTIENVNADLSRFDSSSKSRLADIDNMELKSMFPLNTDKFFISYHLEVKNDELCNRIDNALNASHYDDIMDKRRYADLDSAYFSHHIPEKWSTLVVNDLFPFYQYINYQVRPIHITTVWTLKNGVKVRFDNTGGNLIENSIVVDPDTPRINRPLYSRDDRTIIMNGKYALKPFDLSNSLNSFLDFESCMVHVYFEFPRVYEPTSDTLFLYLTDSLDARKYKLDVAAHITFEMGHLRTYYPKQQMPSQTFVINHFHIDLEDTTNVNLFRRLWPAKYLHSVSPRSVLKKGR